MTSAAAVEARNKAEKILMLDVSLVSGDPWCECDEYILQSAIYTGTSDVGQSGQVLMSGDNGQETKHPFVGRE